MEERKHDTNKVIDLLVKNLDFAQKELLDGMQAHRQTINYMMLVIGSAASSILALHAKLPDGLLDPFIPISIISISSLFLTFLFYVGVGEYNKISRASDYLYETELKIKSLCNCKGDLFGSWIRHNNRSETNSYRIVYYFIFIIVIVLFVVQYYMKSNLWTIIGNPKDKAEKLYRIPLAINGIAVVSILSGLVRFQVDKHKKDAQRKRIKEDAQGNIITTKT